MILPSIYMLSSYVLERFCGMHILYTIIGQILSNIQKQISLHISLQFDNSFPTLKVRQC